MLLAAMVITGCSSDDNIATGDNGGNDNNDCGYIAVSIAQPSSGGVRAADTNDFVNGSDKENKAERGLFFVFNKDGNILGEAQNVALTPSTTTVASPVEKIYDAVIVVDGVKKDDPNKPEAGVQIVCILNAPIAFQSGITKLSQLEDAIDNYGACEEGTFIMTNSVYDDTNGKFAVEVKEDNIATTNSEALKKPVTIHVERVVAKVSASVKADIKLETGDDAYADGEVANFKIKVTGIEVANAGGNSYLFKNVSGFTTNEENSWAWAWDAANFRSYWETVPPLVSATSGKKIFDIKNQSYNTIVGNSPKNDGSFDFTKLTSDNPYTTYVQPNTCMVEGKKSAILVTAQLLETVEEDGKKEEKPVDLIYLRGGYYHSNNALAIIAQHVANKGYFKKEGDNYVQLSTSDFEWTQDLKGMKLSWLKDYEVVAKVKDEVTNVYKKDDKTDKWSESAINTTVIDEMLAGSEADSPYKARYYKDGLCYYYVPIVHRTIPATSADATPTVYEGVVRNHVYQLTINSIKGFGVPVFNPDYVIIPETPKDDQLFYIAATVKVLSWKIVTQEVDFK